jgi:DNA-3-methyladenine glycosylase I
VIIGHDGKPRCAWAGAGDTAFSRYHDDVWGTSTCDESALFEALTLGVFQVGLSWAIVFGKRDAFRKAFRAFDVAKVAAITARDVDRLVRDDSIIRNRGKIQATVDNAPCAPSLPSLPGRPCTPRWLQLIGFQPLAHVCGGDAPVSITRSDPSLP